MPETKVTEEEKESLDTKVKQEEEEDSGLLSDLLGMFKEYIKEHPIRTLEHLFIILLGINWAKKLSLFGPKTLRGIYEFVGTQFAAKVGDPVIKYGRWHKWLVIAFSAITAILLIFGFALLNYGIITAGLIFPIFYWLLIMVAISLLIIVVKRSGAFKKEKVIDIKKVEEVCRSTLKSFWNQGIAPIIALLAYIVIMTRFDSVVLKSHRELLIFNAAFILLWIAYFKWMSRFTTNIVRINFITVVVIAALLLFPQPWVNRVKAQCNRWIGGEIPVETVAYLEAALANPSLLPRGDPLQGDVNGDGKFDINDIDYLRLCVVDSSGPAPVNWPPIPISTKKKVEPVKKVEAVQPETTKATATPPPEFPEKVITLSVLAKEYIPASIVAPNGQEVLLIVNDQPANGDPQARDDNSGKFYVKAICRKDGKLELTAEGTIVWCNWNGIFMECGPEGTPRSKWSKYLGEAKYICPEANPGALIARVDGQWRTVGYLAII